jgi:TPR repeat protein
MLAAEQGDASAQFNLGMMYAKGEGVLQDHTKAAKWWKLAAKQGCAQAQFTYGGMYLKGQGVLQDHTKAAK